jgi:hypothetical protein
MQKIKMKRKYFTTYSLFFLGKPDFPRFSADFKNYRFGWKDNDESIPSILSFIQLK